MCKNAQILAVSLFEKTRLVAKFIAFDAQQRFRSAAA